MKHELDSLLSVPDSDYLVVLGYNPGYPKKYVREWQERKYRELKEKYNIGENSCISDLLRYFISIADPEESKIPYEILFLRFREKGWNEEELTKSLEKLRNWGIVKVRNLDKRGKKILELDLMRRALEVLGKLYTRDLSELEESTSEDYLADVDALGKLQHSRIEKYVVSRIKIPKSVLRHFDLQSWNATSFIRGMSEEDLRKLDEKYKIVEKIELKGLDLSQRAKILAQTYRKYSMRGSRIELTPEERIQLLNQVVEELKKLPYISKILLAGSMADNAYTESSDIDLLIVSSTQNKNLNEVVRNFHPSIDPFLFTEKEYEELVKREKLIVLTAKELYSKCT